MARPFPSIRKPSAGWTGAVNYTLEDHIASPYPHPIYPRKDGVLPNDSITRHMADAGAHRKYFLSTAELIFTKAEYEDNKTRNGATITDPTTRESSLYQYLITAPALAAILADYSASGGFSYENLVKEITGSVGSHEYTMCTESDTPYYAPSIGLFVDLFDKFNAVVGILPSQSKPTISTPTALTQVFALKSHTHAAYESNGISHKEIWDAINAGGGGSGGTGGVIDGTLCTDAATGEPCVTEIELFDGSTPNNLASYTYTVQHNCLLFIQLKNAIIADNESSSVPRDCILVKAGEQVIGTLTDNLQDLWNELDNDGLRIPVKVGTTITLIGDGTTPIFDGSSLTTDSKIVFSEFELTPLSMRIGMPNYDTPTDITNNVCRTVLDESRNYTAAADGFVLFRYNNSDGSKSIFARGYIGTTLVYTSGIVSLQEIQIETTPDRYMSSGMVPVRKGDVIDFKVTNTNGSSIVSLASGDNREYDVIFYPLVGAEHTEGEGPIEYPVFEHAFTDTTDNPFIGTSIPSAADLTITSAKIESMCGRSDIDLNTCNISLKVDVFTPKKNGSTVVVDGNGFAEIDKTHPVYRNEAIVYCDADNSPTGYYNDYSRHLDVSIVGGAAKIAWTDAFKKAPADNSVAASVLLPALSSLVAANAGSVTWDDFGNSYGGYIDNAASLGLENCYIRLTAVIDPCTKIIKQSKAGMFIDGEIAKDDDGNVCKTLVTYADWAANGNVTDGYTYEYTVKTDCLLYMNVGIEINNSTQEEVVIKINGETLDAYTDTSMGASGLIDMNKILSLPLSRGTRVSFYTKATPIHNQRTYSDVLPGGEDFIIKLIEFKMSTELTPAKFPSLAVRICDVDCHEESTNASVLPADSTCEYFTWTESQMRQVFGSSFDFDHARFDVSAVFYVGDSASDYDAAANKLQDDGILISPTGQGQQVRPSVTIDTVNGERVAKLALPGIDYFCSTVKSDTTDGFKLVTRTDGAHLSIGSSGNNLVSDFNTDYNKKVRMRLLLHVSDRRSETSHMYASTPDWDTSKKIDIYHNGIVPADGWIVCMVDDFSQMGNSIVGRVLVNGVEVYSWSWEQDSGDNNTVWVPVPVSKGDVVTYKTKLYTDTVWTDGDITRPAGSTTGRVTTIFYPAKHTQLEVPDFNVPGSAGVIDGTIWKKADGTPEITPVNGASVSKIEYNVHNDCLLAIQITSGAVTGFNGIDVYVNSSVVGRLVSVTDSNAPDCSSMRIPVARGSVIKLVNNAGGGLLTTGSNYGSGEITFTEFKLRATNVVAAMPDYGSSDTRSWLDISSSTSAGSEAAPADGFLLMLYGGVLGDFLVKINELTVLNTSSNQSVGDPDHSVLLPVSKGDIVKWGAIDASNGGFFQLTFIPAKMHEVRTTSASAIEVIAMSSRSVAPSWWKVYSNGWCEQGGLGTENVDIFLSIPFTDTNYGVTGSYTGGAAGESAWLTVIDSTATDAAWRKTNAKFIIALANDTVGPGSVTWRAEGWISDASLLAIKQGKVWDPTADSNAGAWVDPS